MKIVLIGDSIRIGYQPFVIEKLKEADVWGPEENCRHSVWALDNFHAWVVEQSPDILHVNFGIHDSSIYGIYADGKHYISLPQYRLFLQRYIYRLKNELPDTTMIWATTTPRYTPKEATPMKQWNIAEESEIQKYNSAALEIVNKEGLPVNDLHETVMQNDFTKCLSEDGCHMTEFGSEVLSDAIVKAIRRLI